MTGHDHGFAAFPVSWYHLGHLRDWEHGPIRFVLPGGSSFVGYRRASGQLAVLSGRCSHLGADLSRGTINGENLRCPLHGWEYGPGGACVGIPASSTIPAFARQTAYPVAERGGHIFFFNQPQARFPLPFFDGLHPYQLFPAHSFDLIAEVPWYLVAANGFDLQHFRSAHDRELVGEPVVDSPSPFAWRVSATFRVLGKSWRDQLTRRFSGPQVTMIITDWCGNLIFVSAAFRHTTSYGMVSIIPLDHTHTLARVVVWVPRSRTSLGRTLVDPVDAWIRRWFIREFLQSDVERTAGAHYDPARLIDADRVLGNYLDWLKQIHREP